MDDRETRILKATIVWHYAHAMKAYKRHKYDEYQRHVLIADTLSKLVK